MEQSNEQPSFTFTAPFNVEIVEVKGQSKVFLEGIISSTHIDLVDDLVTKNCLESMQKQILSKNLKLDLEHEAFRGDTVEEKELNKTKVPIGKMFDATVQAIEKDHFGLFVKSELNPFNERFESLKGNVREGFLDAYSIAFIPIRTITKSIKGKEIRLLDDVVLLNVALTGNPINTHAINKEVFMKSINSLEEYKNKKQIDPGVENLLEVKHNHISDNQIKLQEVKQMSKEEKDEAKVEEPVDEPKSEEGKKVEEAKASDAKKEPEDEEDAKKKKEADAEKKAMIEEIEKLKSGMEEIKAKLATPVRKSKVELQDKSENFTEAKSQNPLDLIA